jgi:hypothetical protein
MLLLVTPFPLPATVSDLWIPNSHSWNLDLIANIFDDQVVQAITSVQTVPNDILRWTPSKNGQCTTKNIYRHLSNKQLI